MASTRYIEVDSTSRDRILYPYPGEFAIPAYCNDKDSTNLTSDSFPISAWFIPPTVDKNINGIQYTSLWPANLVNDGELVNTHFASIIGDNAYMISVEPANEWVGNSDPTNSNPVFNPYNITKQNFFIGCTILIFDSKMLSKLNNENPVDGIPILSSIIISYNDGRILVEDSLDTINFFGEDVKLAFAIEMNHNPYGKFDLPATIFLPGFEGFLRSSLLSFTVCEYFWKGIDKIINKNNCRTILNSIDNVLYLNEPFEEPVDDEQGNVPSYFLRKNPPQYSSFFHNIHVSYGSIGRVEVAVSGKSYKKGDIIRSGDRLCQYSINEGENLIMEITAVDDIGRVLEVDILHGGFGHTPGLKIIQNIEGTGSCLVLLVSKVYQSFLISDKDLNSNCSQGDLIYFPFLNKLSDNKNDTNNLDIPRFVYYGNCNVDIQEKSGYPYSSSNGNYPSGVALVIDCDTEGEFTRVYVDTNIQIQFTELLDDGSLQYKSLNKANTKGILYNQRIEILKVTQSLTNALLYSGSTVSQNQMVCYQIQLVSLLLPNTTLNNFIGGLIAFYPFIYVEFRNLSDPNSGNPGYLYSNNPNSHKALFRVNIDDTNRPLDSRFIKLTGDRTSPIVKFKPNDTLFFRVTLPDGQLFRLQQEDTSPPTLPNPFVQISACFAITRIV